MPCRRSVEPETAGAACIDDGRSRALHVVVADGVENLGCLAPGADPAPAPPAVTPELRAQLSELVAEAFTHLRHGFSERRSDS
mgnify:CR=1 FL=1